MSTIWAFVANNGGAKIYEIKGLGKSITKIQHIDNPDGRKKGTEVYSDRPGRSFDKNGVGRHALSTQVDFHLHELQVFAKKLGELIVKAHDDRSFDQLAIIAPPQFIGEIKHHIPNRLNGVIYVNKDLPDSIPENQVIEHLKGYLDLWNTEERKLTR